MVRPLMPSVLGWGYKYCANRCVSGRR